MQLSNILVCFVLTVSMCMCSFHPTSTSTQPMPTITPFSILTKRSVPDPVPEMGPKHGGSPYGGLVSQPGGAYATPTCSSSNAYVPPTTVPVPTRAAEPPSEDPTITANPELPLPPRAAMTTPSTTTATETSTVYVQTSTCPPVPVCTCKPENGAYAAPSLGGGAYQAPRDTPNGASPFTTPEEGTPEVKSPPGYSGGNGATPTAPQTDDKNLQALSFDGKEELADEKPNSASTSISSAVGVGSMIAAILALW